MTGQRQVHPRSLQVVHDMRFTVRFYHHDGPNLDSVSLGVCGADVSPPGVWRPGLPEPDAGRRWVVGGGGEFRRGYGRGSTTSWAVIAGR